MAHKVKVVNEYVLETKHDGYHYLHLEPKWWLFQSDTTHQLLDISFPYRFLSYAALLTHLSLVDTGS